jgi:hypothetical protein
VSDRQEFVKVRGSLCIEWKKSSSLGELKLRYSRPSERNTSMMLDAVMEWQNVAVGQERMERLDTNYEKHSRTAVIYLIYLRGC